MPLGVRLVKLHSIKKLYIVKVVLIKRAFVPCVANRF